MRYDSLFENGKIFINESFDCFLLFEKGEKKFVNKCECLYRVKRIWYIRSLY